ncbi:MAG: N-acetylmuramoyl-L-alanine amidase [Deltaproteobacteria bacterium]|nr:MAG: N-acetylmuramoyl-L-alanine amidase [Deltaproteobacteria bacterium]
MKQMFRNALLRFVVAVPLGLAFACAGEITAPAPDGAGDESAGDPEDLYTVDLDDLFDEAAAEFGVPSPLLAAIGYVESRWEMVVGDAHDDQAAAYGVMGLRGDRIARGARLAGIDEDDVRFDERGNIRAAAALLREQADALGIDPDADIGAWAPAVAAFSGIDDELARAAYVVDDVYGVLATGASLAAEDGTPIATIEPQPSVVPAYARPPEPEVPQGTADYPSAVWRPSPNHSARSTGSIGKIAMVIIHTCEGGYSGCWGWLRNTAAGASAHYVVKENGAEITQLVREYRKAWHIAASYSCSRNGGVDCWRNGYNSNNFTVGIEHAGYASQKSFPSGQIEASAKLVCDITRDHGIKRDKYHIVGHGQLQPWNRTDPGPNWPWTHYLNRVRAYCGDGGGSGGSGGSGGGGGGGGGAIVVDSNNSRNDASKAKIVVSSNWTASNATAGYYGTGYWWASTQPVSDGAEFRFYLAADATKTIDAWWTAGSNRSDAAPFVVFDAAGNRLATVKKNQRVAGRQWNTLGTWRFKKGWNKVVLSRWAPSGAVVVADAIRVR